jgi:hypothetical protein
MEVNDAPKINVNAENKRWLRILVKNPSIYIEC